MCMELHDILSSNHRAYGEGITLVTLIKNLCQGCLVIIDDYSHHRQLYLQRPHLLADMRQSTDELVSHYLS